MGRAVVFDLTRQRRCRPPRRDGRRARARGRPPLRARPGEGRRRRGRREGLAAVIRGVDVLVHCGPYGLNLAAMDAALSARCHHVDLGGLFHTTRRQLARDGELRRRGLLAVLGMGSAPGRPTCSPASARDGLTRVQAIRVYNGGADFTPGRGAPVLRLSPRPRCSTRLSQRPMVFTKGRFRLPRLPFPAARTSASTSGRSACIGASTPRSRPAPCPSRTQGIRECAFKIAYDPAFIEKMRLLIDLGSPTPRPGPRGSLRRDVLLDALRALPAGPDVVDDRDALAVVVEGRDRRGPVTVRRRAHGGTAATATLSAVARNTGFPARASSPGMLLDGRDPRARASSRRRTCACRSSSFPRRALAARGLDGGGDAPCGRDPQPRRSRRRHASRCRGIAIRWIPTPAVVPSLEILLALPDSRIDEVFLGRRHRRRDLSRRARPEVTASSCTARLHARPDAAAHLARSASYPNANRPRRARDPRTDRPCRLPKPRRGACYKQT